MSARDNKTLFTNAGTDDPFGDYAQADRTMLQKNVLQFDTKAFLQAFPAEATDAAFKADGAGGGAKGVVKAGLFLNPGSSTGSPTDSAVGGDCLTVGGSVEIHRALEVLEGLTLCQDVTSGDKGELKMKGHTVQYSNSGAVLSNYTGASVQTTTAGDYAVDVSTNEANLLLDANGVSTMESAVSFHLGAGGLGGTVACVSVVKSKDDAGSDAFQTTLNAGTTEELKLDSSNNSAALKAELDITMDSNNGSVSMAAKKGEVTNGKGTGAGLTLGDAGVSYLQSQDTLTLGARYSGEVLAATAAYLQFKSAQGGESLGAEKALITMNAGSSNQFTLDAKTNAATLEASDLNFNATNDVLATAGDNSTGGARLLLDADGGSHLQSKTTLTLGANGKGAGTAATAADAYLCFDAAANASSATVTMQADGAKLVLSKSNVADKDSAKLSAHMGCELNFNTTLARTGPTDASALALGFGSNTALVDGSGGAELKADGGVSIIVGDSSNELWLESGGRSWLSGSTSVTIASYASAHDAGGGGGGGFAEQENLLHVEHDGDAKLRGSASVEVRCFSNNNQLTLDYNGHTILTGNVSARVSVTHDDTKNELTLDEKHTKLKAKETTVISASSTTSASTDSGNSLKLEANDVGVAGNPPLTDANNGGHTVLQGSKKCDVQVNAANSLKFVTNPNDISGSGAGDNTGTATLKSYKTTLIQAGVDADGNALELNGSSVGGAAKGATTLCGSESVTVKHTTGANKLVLDASSATLTGGTSDIHLENGSITLTSALTDVQGNFLVNGASTKFSTPGGTFEGKNLLNLFGNAEVGSQFAVQNKQIILDSVGVNLASAATLATSSTLAGDGKTAYMSLTGTAIQTRAEQFTHYGSMVIEATNSGSVPADLTVRGNLFVQGTTTTINTTQTTIADKEIVLNRGGANDGNVATGTAPDFAGIRIERGPSRKDLLMRFNWTTDADATEGVQGADTSTPQVRFTRANHATLAGTDDDEGKVGDQDASNVALGVGDSTNDIGIICKHIVTSSDARWKHNIKPVRNSKDIINKMRPVYWDWNGENAASECGLIAQHVKKIAPDAVRGSERDGYGLNYNYFIGLLMARVKELTKEVESIKR